MESSDHNQARRVENSDELNERRETVRNDTSLETTPDFNILKPEVVLEKAKKLGAIIIFEGNTVVRRDVPTLVQPAIRPTAYSHSDRVKLFLDEGEKDTHAMLGGHVRPLAAAMMAVGLGAETPQLIFVGGNSIRKGESHGTPHSGSQVYKETFEREYLRFYNGATNPEERKPRTAIFAPTKPKEALILDHSENSGGDILHAFEYAVENQLTSLGFLSNKYHLGRLLVTADKIKKENHGRFDGITIELLDAEDVILSLATPERLMEKYKRVFEAAYKQKTALDRVRAERQGVNMLKNDTYRGSEGKSVTGGEKAA